MNTVFNILLAVHILGGTLGLVFSMVALAGAKGGRLHRIGGQLFFWGMVGAGLSSLGLAAIHPNPFLAAIGIFSLYLSLSGRRALAWRRLGEISTLPDAALIGVMMLAGLGMLGYGLGMLGGQTGIVLAIFGSIGFFSALGDYRIVFAARRPRQFWLAAHATKMLAATISAYTAFGVVNMDKLPAMPPLVVWLLPTALGSAAIAYWQRRIRVQGLKSA